ncbi:MAG: peroxide stress protein YaaA [Burkholderiales bacterium]
MLIVLSPAKTLDFESPVLEVPTQKPEFATDAQALVRRMRAFDVGGVARLMDLSESLASLNVQRYKDYRPTPKPGQARAAVLAFDGDVYDGLKARELDADGLAFAESHLRILSGLYGVLRPLDAMQPYRLEMGTRLDTERGRDLYAWWGDKPARALRKAMKQVNAQALVNLASQEYFGAVDVRALGERVVTPLFQERRAKGWQMVSFSAKRARGLMTRYAIDRRITDPEALKAFNLEGYAFDPEASDDQTWMFRREQP